MSRIWWYLLEIYKQWNTTMKSKLHHQALKLMKLHYVKDKPWGLVSLLDRAWRRSRKALSRRETKPRGLSGIVYDLIWLDPLKTKYDQHFITQSDHLSLISLWLLNITLQKCITVLFRITRVLPRVYCHNIVLYLCEADANYCISSLAYWTDSHVNWMIQNGCFKR